MWTKVNTSKITLVEKPQLFCYLHFFKLNSSLVFFFFFITAFKKTAVVNPKVCQSFYQMEQNSEDIELQSKIIKTKTWKIYRYTSSNKCLKKPTKNIVNKSCLQNKSCEMLRERLL